MNTLIPKNVRYQTNKHRSRYPPLVVVVPSRLRAVVAIALVTQTRGSLALLGFGERTLVSTLGDAALGFRV